MNSRQKGKVGEREFAALLREHGFDARRGQQFSGGADSPDVVSEQLSWIHFEVKRVQNLNLTDACAQAEGDCGGKPWAVAHRKNHAPWLITMRAEFFFELIRNFGSTVELISPQTGDKPAQVPRSPRFSADNFTPTAGLAETQTGVTSATYVRQTKNRTDVPPFSNEMNLGSAGAQPDSSKQNN